MYIPEHQINRILGNTPSFFTFLGDGHGDFCRGFTLALLITDLVEPNSEHFIGPTITIYEQLLQQYKQFKV